MVKRQMQIEFTIIMDLIWDLDLKQLGRKQNVELIVFSDGDL